VRELPDTIIVKVKERTPVALLTPTRTETTPQGQENSKIEYYLIDNSGQVYMKIPRKVSLPQFVYSALSEELKTDEQILGYTFDQQVVSHLVATVQSLQELPWLTIRSVELVDDFTVKVTLMSDTVLLMSLTKNLAEQVRTLELIQQQVVYSGRSLESIDTRFDKAIVRYR
jgi:cell division septal protein FtsQ